MLDGVRSEGMRFHASAGKIEDSLARLLSCVNPQKGEVADDMAKDTKILELG